MFVWKPIATAPTDVELELCTPNSCIGRTRKCAVHDPAHRDACEQASFASRTSDMRGGGSNPNALSAFDRGTTDAAYLNFKSTFSVCGATVCCCAITTL